ncbi:gamma-glutamyltranspeptidase [Beijerinckiaceae bacterium RH AL1]|nr:gamma-glutamyltransferase [Beijerinckiaceae bacterium]VVB48867.1 gamma-glutamyltranspeptidase [Beijerinckiaceae bacterium RH CH11]VVB48944.1 gamma-glutamyltranspeptidase [Beijerinckiaceae bacterium RH AL8]VVC56607.1 gamma-glutamyltranspeptidase [Beijerinckiaceae bacterium RH AL1]
MIFVLAALLLPLPALAEEPPILGQGARNLPVIARHGMVVAQEGTAARVGLEILKKGGNAVDAAVATALALAVTLPRAGNLGGGGFMLVHLARENKTVAIDYRETAPAATKPDVFLDAAGDAVARLSRDTGLAVGTPGTVAGLALALEKYGSHKFTFADLVAPAEKLAHDGIPVEDDLADSLAKQTRLKRWPSSAAIFLHPDGSPLGHGEILRQTDLADTLASIAKDGPKGFYEGPVAQKIVAAVKAAGGAITADDLAGYRAIERAPIEGTYRGHRVVSMPPPSSGGVHVIELLNILEGLPLARQGALSAKTIHDMAEAEKLAYADRAEYLADPAFVDVPVKGLISKSYAEKLRGLIDPARAKPATEIAAIDPAPYESEQTTHFSVVDADGNAVANTYTLNLSFGVGLVADGTGVLLNDELDDFAAKPGVPNAFGLTGGKANAPGPRKRPLSSMTPTLMFADGKLELVTGSPGGSTIITTVLQLILDRVDFKLNIAAATELPRVHDQLLPDQLFVEPGLSPDTLRLLQAMGYTLHPRDAWGSASSIAVEDGLLAGAADTRQRGTLAVGY